MRTLLPQFERRRPSWSDFVPGRKNVEFLQTSFLSLAKRGIDGDISPTGFHKWNWEAVKIMIGEWLSSGKKTPFVGSFGRYLQDSEIPIRPYPNLEASQLINRR